MARKAHARASDRTDLLQAGSDDAAATQLYAFWHNVRRRPPIYSAALASIALIAREECDLADVATRLGALPEIEGTVCHRIATQLHACGVSATQLVLAWEIAADADPPIWADACARMPRLGIIRRDLPLDPAFHALSLVGRLLLLSMAGEAGGRPLVVDWSALGRSVNVFAQAALNAVADLEAGGWLHRERFYPSEVTGSVLTVLPRVFERRYPGSSVNA